MRLGSFETPAGERLVGELVGDRVHRLEAPTMPAWLAGEGRDRTGEELDVGELRQARAGARAAERPRLLRL